MFSVPWRMLLETVFQNKEVATKLNLSVYTVDSHRGKIMEKLNLHGTGELVRSESKMAQAGEILNRER